MRDKKTGRQEKLYTAVLRKNGEGDFQEEISIEPDISNNCNNVVFQKPVHWDHHLERRRAGSSRFKLMFILRIDEKK